MIQFKARAPWPTREIACRISMILGESSVDWVGNPIDRDLQRVSFDQDPKWQLDMANNWWMYKIGENAEKTETTYGLDCRTAVPPQVMESLKLFLEWTFNR